MLFATTSIHISVKHISHKVIIILFGLLVNRDAPNRNRMDMAREYYGPRYQTFEDAGKHILFTVHRLVANRFLHS